MFAHWHLASYCSARMFWSHCSSKHKMTQMVSVDSRLLHGQVILLCLLSSAESGLPLWLPPFLRTGTATWGLNRLSIKEQINKARNAGFAGALTENIYCKLLKKNLIHREKSSLKRVKDFSNILQYKSYLILIHDYFINFCVLCDGLKKKKKKSFFFSAASNTTIFQPRPQQTPPQGKTSKSSLHRGPQWHHKELGRGKDPNKYWLSSWTVYGRCVQAGRHRRPQSSPQQPTALSKLCDSTELQSNVGGSVCRAAWVASPCWHRSRLKRSS